ncbi:uncharacterized protein LOC127434535 [Myxocyprinus asiaticus]|uniref:uncharacterized protein LOC127434535 n=1 Tax=Myxocyprinus asiaticus TaxID=70543 RepID=UPI00222291C9|nr:uncharacterized protein LOC127434535 [Myxocyprinus asiaticus]
MLVSGRSHPWWFFVSPLFISAVLGSGSSDILTDAAFQEIAFLYRKVRELNVSMGHGVLTLEGLCMRRYKKCIPKILDIYKLFGKHLDTTELTFPFFRYGFSYIFLGYSVTHSTSLSRQKEFEANTKDVIPLFSITYVIAIALSILFCMKFDCVRNKVWVSTFRVFSAGLAVLSSFGMMLHIGVPFVMTVANSPFLILGINITVL